MAVKYAAMFLCEALQFYAPHLLAKRYLLSLHTAARSMLLRSIEYDGGRLFVARGLILFGGGQRLKA